MTEEQLQLINIVSNQLFNTAFDIPENTDWNSVLDESQLQSVFPVVYDYLMKRNPELLNNHLFQKYNILYSRFYAEAIRNLHFHEELHNLLFNNKIPYVILKGQASALYYPDSLLRTMGDVDFLIDIVNRDIVDELLIDSGFIKSNFTEKHLFHWAYTKDKAKLEMHWEIPGLPKKHHTIDKYVQNIIDKAVICNTQNGKFYIPSEFHHGLVLLLHMLSHMTSTGLGLRHLLDWLVFENSIPEDDFLEKFELPLKSIGLWKFVQVLTKIGELYFGFNPRKWSISVNADLCSDLLEDVIDGGNFGIKDDSRKIQTKFIRDSETRKIEGGSSLRNLIVNVNAKARNDFPPAKRYSVLLPIGWFLVGIQYFRWSYNKGIVIDKRTVLNIKRRKKIYSELKLFE